jgi:hypothetical protein
MKRVLCAVVAGLALGALGLWFLSSGKTLDSLGVAAAEAESSVPGAPFDRSPPRSRSVRPFQPLPSAPPSVVTNQNDPSYDVFRLIKVLDISVATAFDHEQRDPAWAPLRERAITTVVQRDLQNVKANARLVRTECRHATCEMLFEGPTLEEARWGSLLVQYAPLAAMTEPGQPVQRDGKVYLPVFLAMQPEERPNEGWEPIYQQERKAQLAMRRQGGPPRPGFPPYPED